MFRSIVALIAGVLAVTLVSTSLAALPTKGGVYQGTLYASGTGALTKKVRINVAASGKTARVTWWCGLGRSPSSLQFPIKADGTFKAYSNTGTLTVWSRMLGDEVTPGASSPNRSPHHSVQQRRRSSIVFGPSVCCCWRFHST